MYELTDIMSDYKVKVTFFADDLKMYHAEIITDDDVECFSSALSCIVDWANTWQLQISITKCCVLHLNTKCISDSLKPFLLNGIPLPVHQSVGPWCNSK